MSRTKKALQLLVGIGFLMALFALAVGEIVPHPEEIQFKLSQTKALSPFSASSHDNLKSLNNVARPKEERTGTPNVPDPAKVRQGGDNVGSATVISSIPFSVSGSTSGYTDDYNEVCDYTTTGAPDVVYSYVPAVNESIDLSLCTSLYDTKMYIYENSVTPGSPLACNDDACGDDGYKSQLSGVVLTAGSTYYIVVDGYGSTDYGTYYLDIVPHTDCVVECPTGAAMESEACGDDANGGCNMGTPTWEPIACGETVCGTIWSNTSTRDTDWYELTLTEAKSVTWAATGEFPIVVGYIAGCPMGAPDCSCITELDPYATGDPCQEASVTVDLGVGTHWFFVSTTVYADNPCGGTNEYVVSMTCGAPPVGRCCYGVPQGSECADLDLGECQALGGSWTAGVTCASDPCPIAGPNDDCVNAVNLPGPYPELVTGTTAGAAIDCPGVLDWNAVWYKFDVPYTCANVTMDYCAGGPEVLCLGVVIYAACDDCPNYILYSENLWLDCSGITQPLTKFNMVSGPATYYYPVFIGDADCLNIESDFAFYVDIQECPPAQPGDDCSDPLAITLPGDLPYLDNNYTCGRLDNYDNTCLGYYDGGEDIIYEVTVTAACDVDIKLDPLGTTYSGILIDDACPADPTTCIGMSSTSGSGAHTIMNVHLDPGTYYIMADTWPSPDCIPAFDLSITVAEGPTPGDNCADPIIVKVPADLPYADLGQTNCGRLNDYSATCLGSYDGGEDIIYRLDVTDASIVTITMDPKTTTWTGMAIDDECPLNATTCIAQVTNSGAAPAVFTDLPLAPGVYYIMIDTYPSPNCIPDFDLTITAAASPPELTYAPTSFDFTANYAGEFGDDVLTLGNIGGANLSYSVSVSYAKDDKEIDGATITALDEYIPGGTADIEFQIQNASSDAEWIDVATITFPASVTVVGSTNFVVVGQTRYLLYDGTTGTAVTVTWADDNGGYGEIYSTEAAVATMTISVAAGTTGPLTCDWTLSGDDYGSTPHDVAGTLTIEQFDPYTSWLTCAASGSIAPGGNVPIPVIWNSVGMATGTYTADIVVDHNGKTITEIPVTLHVNAGVAATYVDPSPAYMYYMFAYDPMYATIDVAVTGTVATATANGVAAAIVTQDGSTATLSVPIAGFLVGYGAPMGTVQKSFSVAGTYDDMSTFAGGGTLTVMGKNPISPKSWLIPQNDVVLYGDADATGGIDMDDAVTLIQFIFQGQFMPGPSLIGDCDCSVFTDIDDVVYIINYIFSGGPFPCQAN